MFAWNAHGIPTGAGLVTSCCLRDAKNDAKEISFILFQWLQSCMHASSHSQMLFVRVETLTVTSVQ
jgi:hypothetical protein